MLTAKGETSDKVSGLEWVADDYIVKHSAWRGYGKTPRCAAPYYTAGGAEAAGGCDPDEESVYQSRDFSQTNQVSKIDYHEGRRD